jgi:hypothetical protein
MGGFHSRHPGDFQGTWIAPPLRLFKRPCQRDRARAIGQKRGEGHPGNEAEMTHAGATPLAKAEARRQSDYSEKNAKMAQLTFAFLIAPSTPLGAMLTNTGGFPGNFAPLFFSHSRSCLRFPPPGV